ncbi:fibroleukin-like [Drosophila rhopaloa]|uniref:Fibrinogen C-terminal domain-containing protein n=1 Tax=Drosophila rhopaloa TaxID=1041015 RepID=A0ABM5GX00_DRORH|nr:fibroleukin-like [Drosophila rhopaloa]
MGNPTNLSDMPSNMALKNLESKIREKEIMLEKLETKVETDGNIISNLKSQIRDKDILLVNFEDKAQADKNENKEQRKAISGLENKISELEDKLKQTNENLAIYKKQGSAEEMVASSPMILFNYTKTSMEIFKARNVEALHKLDLINLTIGSGWIVVQKHFNDGEDFDTPVISKISDSFQDQSLGTPEESFWLGCELLHKITTGRRHELYILLSYFNGHQIYALYDDFVVGPGPDYKLKSLGKYEGDAGDGLRSHENQKFRSYSLSSESVCSRWWESKDDGYFNLNVPYRNGKLYIEPNEFVCASRMFIRPRT